MGQLGVHLLQCTSFPPPLPFCGFSPNNIVEKLLRTGNILSKGYPALWHLKCCAFLPICHCTGQLPACKSLCNALGWPGRASPCTPPSRIPASQLWINQLLQVSSRFPFLCTQPPWSKETWRNAAFQAPLAIRSTSSPRSPDKVL